MNCEPQKARRDFVTMLRKLEVAQSLEVVLDDGNKWFIMRLEGVHGAKYPYCIFSAIYSEPIFGSGLTIDDDGVEFLDGNQMRGFHWYAVDWIIRRSGSKKVI